MSLGNIMWQKRIDNPRDQVNIWSSKTGPRLVNKGQKLNSEAGKQKGTQK